MRWYTGKQLFAVSFASAAAVLLIAYFLGLLSVGSGAPSVTPVSDASSTFKLQSSAPHDSTTLVKGDTTPGAADTPAYTADEQNNISIYEMANGAVVNISTEVQYYSFFDTGTEAGGTGSGVIIDKRGYILTNNHVVKDATKLYVTLATGERLDGTLVGADPENDLAIVKIEPGTHDLKTIPLGSSQDLRVGQKVLAIGNPYSFDRTLTVGVISALGRPVKNDSGIVVRNMIQIDASINPGNSGGPLLDSKGNLIGINSSIYSPTGASVGLGFAIPVETAKRVVPELITNHKVSRGWISMSFVALFPELVRYANLSPDKGVLVSQVSSGSNAAKAGIRGGSSSSAVRYGRSVIYLGGDIITEIDGVAIESVENIYEALEDNKPGQTVKVVLYRGGRRIETTVQLVERPDQSQ